MKAKLVKESLKESSADFYASRPFGNAPGQEDIDRQNLEKAEVFDTEEFWQDVAERMGGELESFDLEEEGRIISIRMPDGEIMEIEQSWHYDGSPTKPLTNINGEDLGRFAIWDHPGDVAENYLEHYDRYANYRQHTDYDEDEMYESKNNKNMKARLIKEGLNEAFGKTLTMEEVEDRFERGNRDIERKIEKIKRQLAYYEGKIEDSVPSLYELADLLNSLDLGMNNWYWVEPHSSGNAKIAVRVDAKGMGPDDKQQLKEDLMQIIDTVNSSLQGIMIQDTERGYLFDNDNEFMFWVI